MENTQDIDQEKTEKIRVYWNKMRAIYEEAIEHTTIQSGMILYSMTKASYASKICEVGAGCGLAPRMFFAELMKDNCVYFSSDISEEMNQTFVER